MGIVYCEAKNNIGTSTLSKNVIFRNEFNVWIEIEPPIVVGDNVSMICDASLHKYTNDLDWFRNGVLVGSELGNDFDVQNQSSWPKAYS